MEATKVKVRERDLAVCRHRTWHRILFLPPHSSPQSSFPLSPRPAPPVLAHVSAYRFFGPPQKRHHLTGRSNSWWKPRPSWNRVTLRHACHVIAVRVSPRALRSRFRRGITAYDDARRFVERKKRKKQKRDETRFLSFLFFSFSSSLDQRADSLSANRQRRSWSVTQRPCRLRNGRANDELLHLTTV